MNLGRRLRYGVVALALLLVAAVAVVVTISTRPSKAKPPPTPERPTQIEITLDGAGYRSDNNKVVPGWIKVTFRNRSAESRDIALVRLGPGKTAADLNGALKDPKGVEALGDSFVFEGGATMVLPKTTVSFSTEVFTGRFIFGALPDLAKGVGKPASLEVGSGDPPLADPKTRSTIRLDAFSHALLGDIKKSEPQTVSVVAEGPGVHEVRLYKVADDVSPSTAYGTVPAMKDAPDRATPFVRPVFGSGAMAPGFINVRDLSLTPGHYIMTCFLMHADTGKTYAELGMSTPFDVS